MSDAPRPRFRVDAQDGSARAGVLETAHGRLETPAYKALIGTSRRTAMPLMELLDDLRVTQRKGDVRVLRGGSA